MTVTKPNQIQIASPVIGEEERRAVCEVLESGWLTQGPRVAAFEKKFAEIHGVKHAIAVTSCTTGLHLALTAMGIGTGDEVILPAFTWVATANVVVQCGATPVFADVDPVTYNIDPQDVLKRVTPQTKAVMPVHLFGLCSDMDTIREILPEHIQILEDAACAAGAIYKDRSAGSLGAAGVFSFHPRKSITTGEGGMITTNDDQIAELSAMLRNHGASISEEQRHRGSKPYLLPEFSHLGFNYRMTDLQGAVGLAQLTQLKRFIKERDRWANWYIQELNSIPWLRMPERPCDGTHAWQAFVTYIDPATASVSRNHLMERLQEAGISTRPGTHAVHMLGYYAQRFGLKPNDYPGAMDCDHNTMAIPLHNQMSEDDYQHVVNTLKEMD